MAYINLFVGNNAYINVKNKQLYLTNEFKVDNFPIEDINSILIENLQSTISVYTLSKLSQNNVLIYICDEKHLPCAYVLPFYNHYNQSKIFKIQNELPAALRKQLWKDIVKQKIKNQNECLVLTKKKSRLEDLILKIKSNDNTNIEAVAANRYFKALFFPKFSREQENSINAALNYGYAIIRGVVARSVVSHGLLPFLGLKHSNVFNNYNLADDLMEIFRPFVDLCVHDNFDLKFDREYKIMLYNLLNCDCEIIGAKYTLSYGIELFIQSFVDSLSSKENKLKFPKLIKLSAHEYL